MTFCELFVLQGVLGGLFDVFLHFLTLQAPTVAGNRYWGGKGGRWWTWSVVCGLWRSWEEFAMTFCELFVSQGVLGGLFGVFYTF